MSVIDAPSVIASPSSFHLSMIDGLKGLLTDGAMRLHTAYGPGLITLVLGSEVGGWRLGFTPRHLADVAHVMAMGVPEEAALTMLHRLSFYNAATAALLLVVEDGYRMNGPYSFVQIDLT